MKGEFSGLVITLGVTLYIFSLGAFGPQAQAAANTYVSCRRRESPWQKETRNLPQAAANSPTCNAVARPQQKKQTLQAAAGGGIRHRNNYSQRARKPRPFMAGMRAPPCLGLGM